MLSIILIYFFIQSILTLTDQEFSINIEYENNQTIFFIYNLTSQYSYYLTFRLFGHQQYKYGLYSPTNQSIKHSIFISSSNEINDFVSLLIICFHFLVSYNNLDIQCKDIRLIKDFNNNQSKISEDFLPSYTPLFVPMMYALSILMLLPVIIQHHHRQQQLIIRRRKELRRLSVSIAQNKQNPKRKLARRFLSYFSENGTINYQSIPLDIELTSALSSKIVLDENLTVTSSQSNFLSIIHQYNEMNLNEESNMNADDCVAHLLDDTPWNTSSYDQPFSTSLFRQSVIRDCALAIKEQHVPTIVTFYHKNENDDDRKPILNESINSKMNFYLYQPSRTVFESDV